MIYANHHKLINTKIVAGFTLSSSSTYRHKYDETLAKSSSQNTIRNADTFPSAVLIISLRTPRISFGRYTIDQLLPSKKLVSFF